MGTITKDTFKRLFLLYLLNEFKDGAYGKFRLAKIAYFIAREFDPKIFEYKWYHYGQFSDDLSDNLEQLITMDFVASWPLDSERGNKYKVTTKIQDYSVIISKIPGLIEKTKEIVGTWGYAPEQKIKTQAYRFGEIKGLNCEDIIFEENLPSEIKIESFDEEACEELELSFNPKFIASMDKIYKGIETSEFDVTKVKRVDSIL